MRFVRLRGADHERTEDPLVKSFWPAECKVLPSTPQGNPGSRCIRRICQAGILCPGGRGERIEFRLDRLQCSLAEG